MVDESPTEEAIENIAERYRSLLDEDSTVPVLAEAHYRLGLYALIQQRDIVQATQHFQESAGLKDPFWSQAARTSLAICLYRQGKTQKALLEFRKVGLAETVTVHSVNALLMMGRILRDDGESEESERSFTEGLKRIRQQLREPQNDRKEWLVLGFEFALECGANEDLTTWRQALDAYPSDELPPGVRLQLEALEPDG